MPKYKEIQPQQYLGLDTGNIFFNIDRILQMINTPYSSRDSNNYMSPGQLLNYCDKHQIKTIEINTSTIDFAIEHTQTAYFDVHSANQATITVMSSTEFNKLLKSLAISNPVHTKELQKEFKIVDWGMVEHQSDKNELELFYSLNRTKHDIEGRRTSYNIISTIPGRKVSQRQIANKATAIASNESGFKCIKIKPGQINYGSAKITPTKQETYINQPLYDKILNSFAYYRDWNTPQLVDNIKETYKAIDTVRTLMQPYIKGKNENYNANYKTYYITSNEADIIDKQVRTRINKVIKAAKNEFYFAEDEIHRLWLKLGSLEQQKSQLSATLDKPPFKNLIEKDDTASFIIQTVKDILKI